MATSSSILPWRLSWTEEPGGLLSMAHKKLNTIKHAHFCKNHVYILLKHPNYCPSLLFHSASASQEFFMVYFRCFHFLDFCFSVSFSSVNF